MPNHSRRSHIIWPMKRAMLIALVECDDGKPYSRWWVLIADVSLFRTHVTYTTG